MPITSDNPFLFITLACLIYRYLALETGAFQYRQESLLYPGSFPPCFYETHPNLLPFPGTGLLILVLLFDKNGKLDILKTLKEALCDHPIENSMRVSIIGQLIESYSEKFSESQLEEFFLGLYKPFPIMHDFVKGMLQETIEWPLSFPHWLSDKLITIKDECDFLHLIIKLALDSELTLHGSAVYWIVNGMKPEDKPKDLDFLISDFFRGIPFRDLLITYGFDVRRSSDNFNSSYDNNTSFQLSFNGWSIHVDLTLCEKTLQWSTTHSVMMTHCENRILHEEYCKTVENTSIEGIHDVCVVTIDHAKRSTEVSPNNRFRNLMDKKFPLDIIGVPRELKGYDNDNQALAKALIKSMPNIAKYQQRGCHLSLDGIALQAFSRFIRIAPPIRREIKKNLPSDIWNIVLGYIPEEEQPFANLCTEHPDNDTHIDQYEKNKWSCLECEIKRY